MKYIKNRIEKNYLNLFEKNLKIFYKNLVKKMYFFKINFFF